MTTRIVITNHGNRLHKGTAALLHSRVRTLKEFIPDAEFSIFTFRPEIENDLPDIKTFEVICGLSRRTLLTKKTWQTALCLLKCSLWRLLQRHFHWDVRALRNGEGVDEYYNAHVVISTGGDLLTEDYGIFACFAPVVNLLFALLMNKPVVIYAESVGPFKRWWNRAIARFLLDRAELITLREEISKTYLQELGISGTSIYVTADSAFLLESAPIERATEILQKEKIEGNDERLVGISVSRQIAYYGFCELRTPDEKYRKYIELMAQCVDYLIDTLYATVLFIPHVMEPWGNDDRITADDIANLVKNKQKVVSIRNEYTVEETKAIIGQCSLFIGARMHATIASTSMCVPTVAIAYSHKIHGIIGEMLAYKQYVLDIKTFNYDSLISAINDAWNNRIEIRRELESKMEDIKQRASLNATLVKEIIERERHG